MSDIYTDARGNCIHVLFMVHLWTAHAQKNLLRAQEQLSKSAHKSKSKNYSDLEPQKAHRSTILKEETAEENTQEKI